MSRIKLNSPATLRSMHPGVLVAGSSITDGVKFENSQQSTASPPPQL